MQSNSASADYAKCLIFQVERAEIFIVERRQPVRFPHLRKAARDGQYECKSMFGDRIRVRPGRVRHRNAATGTFGNIDVIVASRACGNKF